MKRKRIVHVITTLEKGGAQRVLWNLIQKNSADKFEHIIICLSVKERFSDIFTTNGFSTYHLNGNNIRETVIVFIKLVKLLNSLEPDLIHTWLYHSDLLVSLARFFRLIKGCTIVWSIHHASYSLRSESLHTKITVKILKYLSYYIPKKIIYCSDIALSIHNSYGYNKSCSIVINNSVDSNLFKPNQKYKCSECIFW